MEEPWWGPNIYTNIFNHELKFDQANPENQANPETQKQNLPAKDGHLL